MVTNTAEYFEAAPPHPGEILEREFMEPIGLSQTNLAERLDVAHRRINEIVNEKRRVTPETAIMLGKTFDTTPEFWLNLQMNHDMYETYREEPDRFDDIDPVTV
jgi:addiction module HigA family antidote